MCECDFFANWRRVDYSVVFVSGIQHYTYIYTHTHIYILYLLYMYNSILSYTYIHIYIYIYIYILFQIRFPSRLLQDIYWVEFPGLFVGSQGI